MSFASRFVQKEKESFVTMHRKIQVIEKIKETIAVIAKKEKKDVCGCNVNAVIF